MADSEGGGEKIGIIYGLPWELYELQYQGEQQEEFMKIIKQSTIKIKTAREDLYQAGYKTITENAKWAQAGVNFLTTKQWDIRQTAIDVGAGKTYSFYTNLITTENKTNISYYVSNEMTRNRKKLPLEFLFDALLNTKAGKTVNALEGIIVDLSRDTGFLLDYTSAYDSMKNLFKLVTREGVNMWSGSEFGLGNRFSFEFRQYSEDSVENQVYEPLAFLNVIQNPFTVTRGGTGSLSVTEKVPPLQLELDIGDGQFLLSTQIIKDMKVEMFDVKNTKKGYRATAATVDIQFDNIKPLVVYNFDEFQDPKDTGIQDQVTIITEALTGVTDDQEHYHNDI